MMLRIDNLGPPIPPIYNDEQRDIIIIIEAQKLMSTCF